MRLEKMMPSDSPDKKSPHTFSGVLCLLEAAFELILR